MTEVKHLASYNWIEAKTPTIAVPGSPPLWSDIKVTKRLKKDTGHVYIAQNAARHPDSPLEPLFRALLIENPDYDFRKINLVTDRNNIRKLLTFVDPKSGKNGLEPFTIRAEATGGTVIFCRDETKVEEVIGPAEFRGFGHEFEKAYSSNEIAGSTGHHRIMSALFGGLSLVIRHETDGYVGGGGKSDKAASDGDLHDLLEGLSLESKPKASEVAAEGSKLNIKRSGRAIALCSTLEIKTRVAHKPLAFDEVAPQLWASQTPNLVRAYHTKGVFTVPVVEDISAALQKWETENRKALKVLGAMLKKILEVVKEQGKAIIQYRTDEGDKLTICRDAEEKVKMLPGDLYLQWMKDAADGE